MVVAILARALDGARLVHARVFALPLDLLDAVAAIAGEVVAYVDEAGYVVLYGC